MSDAVPAVSAARRLGQACIHARSRPAIGLSSERHDPLGLAAFDSRRTLAALVDHVPHDAPPFPLTGLTMPRRNRTLTRSLELSLAAPAVIAMRSARMIAAGNTPTAADRREMSRMVSEKIGAFSESWTAMAARQRRAQLDAWSHLMRVCWTAWFAGPMAFASLVDAPR